MKRGNAGVQPTAAGNDGRRVILSVAFPYAAVGATALGGAEVMCSQLERELDSLGFTSVVVAHVESQPAGRLYATTVPPGQITAELRAEVERTHQHNIDSALAENNVALVHTHGFDFHRYKIPEHIPVLVTLHLPPSWYPESIWQAPPNYHFVCVSENQRAACPVWVQHRLRVVPNGVFLPEPSHLRERGRYALMLSRICPEKNLHTGLDAARLAGIPAILAGAVFPYETHQSYFDSEIAPRLTSEGHAHEAKFGREKENAKARFVGPVSGEEKSRLLSRATCLLLPSLAPETSSLASMEALAFGVPVVGFAVGAVPEVVENGRTGFLVQPGEDAARKLAAAITRIPELKRGVCRAAAEERFRWSRTREAYGALFSELALSVPTPTLVISRSAESCRVNPLNPAIDPIAPQVAEQESVPSLIISSEGLLALEGEWAALWQSDPSATPFQHPAWLLPWWHQFGLEGKLQAITLRDGRSKELIGFLPLYMYQYCSPRHSSVSRKLLLVGAGTTDYLGGLWRRGGDWIARRALAFAISGLPVSDRQNLEQLRPDSALARGALQLGLCLDAGEPTSTLDLTRPFPSKIRRNVRRYRRLGEARGCLECSVASNVDEAAIFFDELVKLHAERWRNRGEPGVLEDERVLAHHRATLPLLLEAGLLCLFRLKLEGETMGVLYGLLDGSHVRERRLYLYLIGFAEGFRTLSPGTLLLDEACRYAATHGCTKVDLLRGGEEYKQLWGACSEPTYALRSMSVGKIPVPGERAERVLGPG